MPPFYQYNHTNRTQINVESIQGDIYLSKEQYSTQIASDLEHIKSELLKTLENKLIDTDTYASSNNQLTKAIQKSNKPDPDKKSIAEHLGNAKSLIKDIAAASTLATELDKLIQLVMKVL
jgi:hypothetical protein